jgi:2-aminoadipate transaminase
MPSRPDPPHLLAVEPSLQLARSLRDVQPSQLQEILGMAAARPGALSFAVGMPATDLFPAAALAAAASAALAADRRALQYGVPPARLQEHVVAMMALRGVDCRREQIFLTSGAQQGMDLMARLLLDPGGPVAIEETVYDGIQMVIRAFAPEVAAVPTAGDGGLDLDALESMLVRGLRPAFLYVITDGHNPLGGSLAAGKRERLVDLARRYQMPILEDDAYGFLYYEERPEPPLRARDDRWVFYLGSFSKILAPSLRVGWIVVPEELVSKLSALKHASDIDSSTFAQAALVAYLDAGHLPGHLAAIRGEYRRRRDALLHALAAHFPTGVRWSVPAMGIFVWVELPAGIDTARLVRFALETENVAFSPGRAFAVHGSRHADHCMRLSFANLTPAQIAEGVARLARAVAGFTS